MQLLLKDVKNCTLLHKAGQMIIENRTDFPELHRKPCITTKPDPRYRSDNFLKHSLILVHIWNVTETKSFASGQPFRESHINQFAHASIKGQGLTVRNHDGGVGDVSNKVVENLVVAEGTMTTIMPDHKQGPEHCSLSQPVQRPHES